MTYSEKLKHPLWQKKRLEVLNRSDFTCGMCGSKEKTLHVHHGYYSRGLMPWEYPDDAYHCLCFDCHEARSLVENEINQHLTTLSTPDLVKFMNVVVGATFAIGIDDVVEAVNKTMWHTDEVAR